jgi:hypothetical protein
MRRSNGVSTFVATLILVSITMSLSYVVYEGVDRFSAPEQDVFTNQVSDVGGSPPLYLVDVNASLTSTPLAFEAGGASSQAGVLYLAGTTYGSSHQLCLANATTFFSVHTGAGLLRADGNGRTWIDGYWTQALQVRAGWQEVMFAGASTCGITMPDGVSAVYPSPDISTVPVVGSEPSSTFVLYVPAGESTASLVMVFDGSYDRIA